MQCYHPSVTISDTTTPAPAVISTAVVALNHHPFHPPASCIITYTLPPPTPRHQRHLQQGWPEEQFVVDDAGNSKPLRPEAIGLVLP